MPDKPDRESFLKELLEAYGSVANAPTLPPPGVDAAAEAPVPPIR